MKTIIALLLLMLNTSCSSILTRKSEFDHYPATYPGVKWDYGMFINSSGRTFESMMQLGSIIDFPVSLVFDTLLFPYDYFAVQKETEKKEALHNQ